MTRDLYAGQFTLESLCRRYYETLAAVDESTGAIEEALERRGLAEETLVVFPPDNGFLLGEQGLVDKRAMHGRVASCNRLFCACACMAGGHALRWTA